MEKDFLKIENVELWARVGVLEVERKCGQLFNLDIWIWYDFMKCSKHDDLILTIDYSLLIKQLKDHSRHFSCFTIEKYSEEIIKLVK